MTTTTEWLKATADLRKAIFVDSYESELERIVAEAVANSKSKFTENMEPTFAMKRKAENIASGEVTRRLYKTRSHNGVENPVNDDPIWGPNAKTNTEATTSDPVEDLTDLIEFLKAQTWSEFAQSLASQYGQRGSLSPKQVAAAKKMQATMAAKAKKAEKPESTIDLAAIPSGYYAVPGGDTRLKVRIAHGKPGTKWEGWTFVSDGAEYGQRKNYGSQRPGGTYRGDIEDALKAILVNPAEAQRAYGRLTGSCGACGRLLEDEASIAAGIGPVCAQKW